MKIVIYYTFTQLAGMSATHCSGIYCKYIESIALLLELLYLLYICFYYIQQTKTGNFTFTYKSFNNQYAAVLLGPVLFPPALQHQNHVIEHVFVHVCKLI